MIRKNKDNKEIEKLEAKAKVIKRCRNLDYRQSLVALDQYSIKYGVDSDICFYKALLYEGLRDQQQYARFLRDAIALDQKNHTYLARYGAFCEKNYNYEEAIEYYKNSVKYGEKKDKIYNKIGLLYQKLHNYKLAKQYFNKAIKSAVKDEDKAEYKQNLDYVKTYLD